MTNPILTHVETFTSAADIQAYLNKLNTIGLMYHLDDDPTDTTWSIPVCDLSLEVLVANHDSMWNFCENHDIDPWQWIDVVAGNVLIREY